MSCPTLAHLEQYVAEGDDAGGGELARHLSTCATCREAVERVRANQSLLEGRITPARAELSAAVGVAAPDAVPGYEIVRPLRHGGQGAVFEAVQRSTKRRVALKILLGDVLASEERRRRFEREVELVAGLRHPNIVTVFDSGTTEDGRAYFAMEYVDGLALDRYLATRPQGWRREDSLRIFALICRAVFFAHQRAVIHRDLKPGNVLVDATGAPRLLDFGLAKAFEPSGSAGSPVTLTNEFVGTLAYASPEQVRGESAGTDTRTDVYALGVILYEILAGRSPYPEAAQMPELVRAITDLDPPPPGAGVELDAIVLKALEKDPERRYATAGELGLEIERYLAGEPVEARRASTWYVLRKAVRRHRVGFSAALALFLVVVGAAAGLAVLWRSSVHAAEREAFEAETANEAKDFLRGMLLAVDPDLARGEEPTVREALDQAARRIDELADRPELRAELQTIVGQAYTTIGRYEEALEHLAAAERTAAEQLDEEARVEPRLELAYAQRLSGDHEAAIPTYRAALESLAAVGRSRGREAALAHHGLGMCSMQLGEFDEAESEVRAAVALHEGALGGEDRGYPVALQSLGDLSLARGRFEEAIDRLEHALEVRRALEPEPRVGLANHLRNLANANLALGRYDEAVPHLEEARDVLAELTGEDDPGTLDTSVLLAIALRRSGAVDEARARYQEVLAHRDVFEERGSWDDSSTLHSLGVLAQGLGESADAAELLEASLAIKDELAPGWTPGRAGAVLNLVGALRSAGRRERAEELAREAVDYLLTLPEGERPHYELGLYLLALMAFDRGEHAETRELIEAALALRLETVGEENAQTAEYLHLLGRACARLGDEGAARDALTRAVAAKRAVYPDGHPRLVASEEELAALDG